MYNWLKHHFVPHEGNNHRPHFLRDKSLFHIVGAVVLLEVVFFLLPTIFFPTLVNTFNLSAVLPGVLSTLTNDERTMNHATELSDNKLLDQAAELKAKDMAEKSYFAHTSPEGKTPWYWFNLVGYQYSYAGENLAVNFSDSADVTAAWMNSPTHRANIVNSRYKEIGTGIATGVYKGKEAVFVAQLFGAPRYLAAQNAAAGVSALHTLILSPHQTLNVVLLALLVITVLALVLRLLIKFDRRHGDLMNNGIFLVVFILALYMANNVLARRGIETSFIALDSQEISDQ